MPYIRNIQDFAYELTNNEKIGRLLFIYVFRKAMVTIDLNLNNLR